MGGRLALALLLGPVLVAQPRLDGHGLGDLVLHPLPEEPPVAGLRNVREDRVRLDCLHRVRVRAHRRAFKTIKSLISSD